ncbi:O-acetyl-ADP-ribose deacetylase MACROD2 [Takifugu flavidus]|uniref:O-acetyl-ADP-ribose deacetylase MACROD2 n=1 Tax=Takifugu flavidus TaxID=433684 RepID=A0A5C6PJ08_9TELE|nr:O-acetyl-ADP-ribose deacetylase MACROD2 [Takifugu flavidus]
MVVTFTERLLRLDQDERRKEYRRQDFVPLEKIPSWRQENRFNEEEEEPELTGEGGGLSDKVSLYKGDITVLEVDAIVNAGKGLTSFFWTYLFCVEEEQHLNGDLLPSAGRSAEVLLLRKHHGFDALMLKCLP